MASIAGVLRRGRQLVRRAFGQAFEKRSYAQEGEDLILERMFAGKPSGFYVDVGAHHPQRFSNTYLFYRRGWRGINIDATPGSMRAFRKTRPRDINIECAVAASAGTLKLFQFDEPALNGSSASLSAWRERMTDYRITGTVSVQSRPLRDILADALGDGETRIDFMSIDVEGLDLEVLESNDWQRFRPDVVLVELLARPLDEMATDPVYRFLQERGYRWFAKAINTAFFLDSDFAVRSKLVYQTGEGESCP